MNDGLRDGFRHNAWGTRALLEFCSTLPDEQVRAAAEGTYGSIDATMWHVVAAEAGYLLRLTGRDQDWDWRTDDVPGMDEIGARAEQMAARWEEFLTVPFDAERIVVTRRPDGTSYDVPAGVIVAQALHHGSEHRGQVCTVLTTLGVEPPVLDVWQYARVTGRARQHS